MSTHVPPLHVFTNEDAGLSAFVFAATRGGFNVTLQDLDACAFAPCGANYPTEAGAVAAARALVAP